ncbi:MAG: hypothetical protein M3540_07410, partial [Actinomycetota bacterium]|nr:hypothetical protein [Actinomycetota bacterium]
MDLHRHPFRPEAAELGRADAAVEQQGSLRTGPRLGQQLRRRHPERETRVDELARQTFGSEPGALEDRVEADLLRIAHALVERGEG